MVLVGNLPYKTSEMEVGQFFSRVGQVTNVRYSELGGLF